jgi:gelsolin
MDPIWENFDSKKPGTIVWRVKNFQLNRVESDGIFHEGDSYLIINIRKSSKNNFQYNIHFWIGSETTQDEQGTVAYKAVELDTFLGGQATQYREEQHNESDLFLSYFKAGLRYASGGNASGFHHVVRLEYPKILYWVHDNQVKQIPLVIDGINEDDVFILDCGETILIYRGSSASHKEALLAEYEAFDIKNHRPNTKILHVDTEEQKREFLAIVGSQISHKAETKLIRIKDDGETVVESSDYGLSSDDTYLYQVGNTTWIWVGTNSSYAEANKAWQLATKLTKPTDRLRLIHESHEPETFWLSF